MKTVLIAALCFIVLVNLDGGQAEEEKPLYHPTGGKDPVAEQRVKPEAKEDDPAEEDDGREELYVKDVKKRFRVWDDEADR